MRRAAIVAGAAAALLALAGCGSSANGGSASDDIQVGALSTVTGFGTYFSQASSAAQAYLDYVNAHGGIHGRKFAYTMLDDKATPATAASDARQLVANGAVAIVGDASQLNCLVNSRYYGQVGMADIPALGFTSACFDSPNISGVDVGLFSGMELDLDFASQELHEKNICALVGNLPGYAAAMAPKVQAWQRASGQHLSYYNTTLPVTPDYTPYVIALKAHRCTAVALALPSTVQPLLQALTDQSATNIKVLTVATTFDAADAKVVGKYPSIQVYTYSQFVPYDSTSVAAKTYQDITRGANLPANGTTEAGYIAAYAFVQAVRTVKGPITRASVLAALRHLAPLAVPLLNPRFTFGTASGHQSNTSGLFFVGKDGTWSQVSSAFVSLPAS